MRFSAIEVRRHHDGRAAEIIIPGGEFNMRTARELVVAIERLREDRSLRVVTLGAKGPDFCTGATSDLDPVALAADPVSMLSQLRVPTIAAVRGACRGVGTELILGCDIRLGTPDIRIGLAVDGPMGEPPCWGGLARLPRAIGSGDALRMLLLGAEFDAEVALRRRLIHEVVDSDDDETLQEWIKRLVAAAPLAVELAKEVMHRGIELPLAEALRLEGDMNHLLATTDDRAEGLRAFFERRPADFAGR
ncbi:enoyl-CoA hydratase/isomerase family protein [Ilumatobacter sp.]|uniref:enoyl-CoA hydratase/isomerase family protein n=1 Tax=Ilumatobacter sp. TaxID=1967498 RepID=UPI00375015BC